MVSKYYSEDSQQRKRYFEDQFFSLAKKFASDNRISLDSLLSRIKSLSSFKSTLKMVWSQDTSLLHYLDGMEENDFQSFFDRPAIQDLIKLEVPNVEEIPDEVYQEEGKTKRLFQAEVFDKRSGKKEKVFAKIDMVEIKGKKIQVYRDSKGRFAKKL